MIFTSVLAHTAADPQDNNFLAGSPHYYGEGGHPKFGPDWYYDQLTNVGKTETWNDGKNLFIRIWVGEWGLEETHVAVAKEFDDIPQTKKGNPKVGHFPFKHENLNGISSKVYTIPLEDLDLNVDDLVYIAVHAALSNGETAWANCGGTTAFFTGNNWATYYLYTIQ